MTESNTTPSASWTPPQGTQTRSVLKTATGSQDYTIHADWIQLKKEDKTQAAMFCVAYLQEDAVPSTRPITFLFNGGPGAASAFLHIGAVGPRRIAFTPEGTVPPPPARLVDNRETWLPMSDLVFIDPIGTGWSRVVGDETDTSQPSKKNEFWEVNRDLESLCECISRFLTRHKRWTSPVFLAGESYGGFRVAALAKMLPEYGIGLNGVALISPAIELSTLVGSDYNILPYVDTFPSFAASAYHHKRCAESYLQMPFESFLEEVEIFTQRELTLLLVQGHSMPEDVRSTTFEKMAVYTGLSIEFIRLHQGRITLQAFCRELLKSSQKSLAPHDGLMTAIDPFANRSPYEGPDPVMSTFFSAFTSGSNVLLREELNVETEQEYQLFNREANTSWTDKRRSHFVLNSTGVTDDLRFAMAMNPALEVIIFHGYQDLVTPYFSSKRLLQHMKLPSEVAGHLTLKNYFGGHMYYSREDSRKAFRADAEVFYTKALQHLNAAVS